MEKKFLCYFLDNNFLSDFGSNKPHIFENSDINSGLEVVYSKIESFGRTILCGYDEFGSIQCYLNPCCYKPS